MLQGCSISALGPSIAPVCAPAAMFKRGSLLGLLLLVGCSHAHAEAVPLLPLIQLCDTVNGTCSISQPLVLYNASAPCIHEWEDECTPRYKFQTSVPVIVSSVLTCSPLWAGSYCEIYISTSSTITITATGFVNVSAEVATPVLRGGAATPQPRGTYHIFPFAGDECVVRG